METAEAPKRKSNLRLWGGIIFSAVFSIGMMYLILQDMDWQQALDAIGQQNLTYVILAAIIIGLGLVARGMRWHYLLVGRLPMTRSLNLTYIAFLINNLLPFRVGDLARIEAAARGTHTVPRPVTLSVAVVERMLDLLTLVILFGIAVSGLPSAPEDLQRTVLFVTIFVVVGFAGMIGVATFFRQLTMNIVRGVEARLGVLARLRFAERFAGLLDGLDVVQTPRYLALAVVWNIIAWLALIVAYYLLIAGLFPDSVTVYEATLMVVAVAFAITVPTTIASIGIIEGSVVLSLTSQGYPSEEALAIGLTLHVVTLLSYAVLGIIAMWVETLSIGTVLKSFTSQPQEPALTQQKDTSS